MVNFLHSNRKILKRVKKIEKKIATIYLFGVLYSIVKKNKKVYLKLHYSFNLFIKIPKNIQLYILKKRLIIYGDIRVLKQFVLNFMSLRIPNIYTGIGLREKNDKYILKPGKIRKR